MLYDSWINKMQYSSYRKSRDPVEVYIYDGENPAPFIELLDKYGITNTLTVSTFKWPGMNAVRRTITFIQDDNTFILTKGKYLVRDNLNTFTVYDEYRFKKIFDKANDDVLY